MKKSINFIIDGKQISETSGVESFSIIYAEDQGTHTVAASVSSEVEMREEDFDKIKETFFADCNGREKKLDVKIETNCTDDLEFEIVADGVVLCDAECVASINLTRREHKSCIAEMMDTVFWKEGFLEAAQSGQIKIPKVFYCTQSSPFLSAILFILRFILLPILSLLEAIENFLNFLGFNANIPSLDNYDNLLSGCGRYHHAPLVKDIFSYHANRCGLSFASSILVDDPTYQNTAIFEAAIDKGIKHPVNRAYHEENSTNMTVGQILEELKIVFNADYKIIGDTLHFERIDFFDDRREIELVNTNVFPEFAEESICFSINLENSCAYFRGEYRRDQFDTQGNRTLQFGYRDIVEWNDPPQPVGEEWQEGECIASPAFGAVRNMYDRLTCGRDDGEDFNDKNLDQFRSGAAFGASIGFRRSRAVILDKHMCSLPKLLVFESGFDYDDALVIRREANKRNNMQCYDYNFPLYFDAEYEIPELYQTFHFINNPRADKKLDYFSAASFQYLPEDFCESVKKIHESFYDLYITTEYGRAVASSYDIDFENCTITANDMRISC